MYGENVRMSQTCLDASLRDEPLPEGGVYDMKDLQGVQGSQDRMADPVDGRGSPLTEHQLDSVASDDVARLKHASSPLPSVAVRVRGILRDRV